MDSNNVFPVLPGLKWDIMMTPIFETLVLLAQSGRETRTAQYIYPRYQFSLSYDVLRDGQINVGTSSPYTEWRTLAGFYLQQQGACTSFLYDNPSDDSITGQSIGTGNGTTTQFQLVRTFGVAGGPTWTEPMLDINETPAPQIYLNGTLQSPSNYSIGQFQSGILTFNTAPGSGVAITATFKYYYRVRFVEWQENKSSGANQDGFNQFMYNFWELKNVSFISAR